MKRAIIYIFLSAFFVCAYAQLENEDISNSNKPDSVNAERTTTLAELVVTSDYTWVEGNKLIFVPRKNEKNLATDAISLIENMHIPVLYVEQGGIKSRAGGNVSIFINGIPADDMDLSTFWPKNAMRVEFMETSSDPRFAGKQNILNFIMKEYVAGGVTKLRGKRQFPNDGSYEASTKFVYKKMTYNAMFKGDIFATIVREAISAKVTTMSGTTAISTTELTESRTLTIMQIAATTFMPDLMPAIAPIIPSYCIK